jgi:hypothetical protein
MDNSQMTFPELQEIIFWQQINKQIIELKTRGNDLREEHHKYIQRFSFNNLLFSRITSATLLDEIPIGLVTDFSDTCFVNLKLDSWNGCLLQLLPNTQVLDLEQALVDSFEVLGQYDKRYHPGNNKNDVSDEEELYEFMEQYFEEREKQGRNIADMIRNAYGLKTDWAQWVMGFVEYRPFLVTGENRLFLDFNTSDKKNEIVQNYAENFCRRALSAFEPIIFPLKETNLYGLLFTKQDQKNLKPSLREFLEHEIDILQMETELLRTFCSKLRERIDSLDVYKINICDLSAFSFLDHPFPTV